ncbi:MAG: AMP-binding protein [Caldilineaceae bacterium]|nr:AMP-binding protein [Caldilineaceae bacterium]
MPLTLVHAVQALAASHGDRPAFIFLGDGETESGRLTYAQLESQAGSIATQLQTDDLLGQPVLLAYPPGLDFVAGLLGCWMAGAIAVPCYPPQLDRNRDRLAGILAATEPRVVLTTGGVKRQLERWADPIPRLKTIPYLVTDDLPAVQSGPLRPIRPEDPALIQFTSGTVDQPKGVLLTHAQLLANPTYAARSLGFDAWPAAPVGVSWLPPYHDMGLVGFLFMGLMIGGTGILMPPTAFLHRPFLWLQAISRYRAIYSLAPTFAYDLCVERIPPAQRTALDLSQWQVAVVGAEPVRAETLARFADAFAPSGFQPSAFFPGYGLAEAALVVTSGRSDSLPTVLSVDADALAAGHVTPPQPGKTARQIVGCGRPLADHQVIIVDPDTRQPCPPDRIGEIWVAGPSVGVGYWRQPQATAETFHARLASHQDSNDKIEEFASSDANGGHLRMPNSATHQSSVARTIVSESENLFVETRSSRVRDLAGASQDLLWQTRRVTDPARATDLQIAPVEEAGPWLRTGDLGFLHGNSKPHPSPPQIGEGTDHAHRAHIYGDPAPPPPWGRLGGGELFITGRIKDLIIIRGRNVYAQDVERVAAASHPALQENGCAVFGLPTQSGEGLTVVAEVRPDQRGVGIDEVAAAVRRAIAQTFNVELHALGLLRPGHLPRTTSGKIRRAHCRQKIQDQTLPLLGWKQLTPSAEKEQSMEENPKPQSRLHKQMTLAVRLKMGEILDMDPAGLDLNHSIQELGLGSLQAAALRYELEDTFDLAVPDDLYRQDATVAEFLAALAAWAEGQQAKAGHPS